MEIIQAINKSCDCYKEKKPLSPVGIVVHSTGANNPYLKRYCNNPTELGVNKYNNYAGTGTSAEQASAGIAHAYIGLDKDGKIAVAQTLPFNIRCWGCGSGVNGSYNVSHIQFEICEDSLNDKNYFSVAMLTAAEFCAEMIKRYPAIRISNIVSHAEAAGRGYASNHGDPDHWLKKYGKNMDWFRDMITDHITESEVYRVQVGAFKNRENAEKLKAELSKKGYNTIIVKGVI